MKKLFTLLFLSLVGTAAFAIDWPGVQRYDSINKVDRQRPAEERRVVFIGNSITDFWPVKRPEFFSSNGFIGRGISGQTSYQFLVRLRSDAIELEPQVIVINAGSNDVAENTHPYDADRTFGNIISLVQLVQANGIQPVMTTLLPAENYGWNPALVNVPDKLEDMNRRLEAYAREHGIPFVDYYSSLVSKDGRRAFDAAYTYDGAHPSEAGYAVMEKLVLEVLEPLLKK